MIYFTCVQSNLANCRIATLSPPAAANAFVCCAAHLSAASSEQRAMHSCVFVKMCRHFPLKTVPSRGGIWINHVTCGLPHTSLPLMHLNQFSRFCTAHLCAQRTHTDHATCDICSNRPHLILDKKLFISMTTRRMPDV